MLNLCATLIAGEAGAAVVDVVIVVAVVVSVAAVQGGVLNKVIPGGLLKQPHQAVLAGLLFSSLYSKARWFSQAFCLGGCRLDTRCVPLTIFMSPVSFPSPRNVKVVVVY